MLNEAQKYFVAMCLVCFLFLVGHENGEPGKGQLILSLVHLFWCGQVQPGGKKGVFLK